MIAPVTSKRATPFEQTVVIKIQSSQAIRRNDRQVKVNKIAVVGRITLGSAYTMRIMAGTKSWPIAHQTPKVVRARTIITGTNTADTWSARR